MNRPMLDSNELEAIRLAIGEVVRSTTNVPSGRSVTPIPLIADDRAAELARPAGLKLAGRWATAATRRITRVTGSRVNLDVSGVEIIEASALREEMMTAWTHTLEVEGRRGIAVISAAGQMIEALASSMLGGSPKDAPEDRQPSPTAMRLFSPVGDAIVQGLVDTWQEEQACHVRTPRDPRRADWRQGFGEDDVVVVVTMAVSGITRGIVKLIARPDTLVMPPPRVEAVQASRSAIEDALGGVQVEVRVELGRARLTMGDFSRLRPGDIVPLDQFVDDHLPVQCGGIVKAHGRALVSRGVMAVEMSDANATGSRAA